MQRKSDTGYRWHPVPLLSCCQWCGFWCFVLKVCTKSAGKALVCFGAVKCSVTRLWSSQAFAGYVFRGEQCFQQNDIDESMKLFPPQSPEWQIMISTCTADAVWTSIFNIVWENNATKKSQLRNSVESFPLCCRCSFNILIHSTSEFRSPSKTSWSFSVLIFHCICISSGGSSVFSLTCL